MMIRYINTGDSISFREIDGRYNDLCCTAAFGKSSTRLQRAPASLLDLRDSGRDARAALFVKVKNVRMQLD
jgi:hypothetical protein